MTNYAISPLLGQVLSTECPSREILEHLANKWSVLVLRCLSEGVHRFSELKQRIEGVSEKMLSQTLKMLEQDGFYSQNSLSGGAAKSGISIDHYWFTSG